MIKLFSFWRSLATYRVRIALNLKGITVDEVVEVNLIKGHQHHPAYRVVNPMMALPALVDGDGPILFELLAILEYLDETRPEPPLLPKDARGRARVRGLAQIVACDSHPLIVPRVRDYLEHQFNLGESARMDWCRHWIAAALGGIEEHLKEPQTGIFCHGDEVDHRRRLPREPGRRRPLLRRRYGAVSERRPHHRRVPGDRRLRAARTRCASQGAPAA